MKVLISSKNATQFPRTWRAFSAEPAGICHGNWKLEDFGFVETHPGLNDGQALIFLQHQKNWSYVHKSKNNDHTDTQSKTQKRKKWETSEYPFSNPTGKFLDWEKGVVGARRGACDCEGSEFREGSAKVGNGELRAIERESDRRLVRRECLWSELWKLVVGMREGKGVVLCGLGIGFGGGRRW